MTHTGICVERQSCRICGSPDLQSVINLGEQYIASVFVDAEIPPLLQRPYPLEVVRCAAPDRCGLVQLKQTISARLLYANYGYRSGTNEIMRANLREIVATAEQIVELHADDLVLDIGCNDGTLLDAYQTPGIDRLGFDPAVNVTSSARAKGIEVVNDFFSAAACTKVRPRQKPRVITSIAMFYDLEEPTRFVADIASLLADDGVWVIELSYLPFMLRKNLFDTICHEHLEYYALRQIEWMVRGAGLRVHRVDFNDVNGGSFRLFIRKQGVDVDDAHARTLQAARADEALLRLDSDDPYDRFRTDVQQVREDLRKLLLQLKAAGKTVYAYGASTKGNTILQFCGIDKTVVTKAADRNPEKWGRRTLGTDIPIISEEQARTEKPDYFLVLPWHFLEGFVRREQAFLNRGGQFIMPLPSVRVVGKQDV
jgi:NDP-4-keto-2,6-dideoxyhexose 3-C-methyltransferase